MFKYLCVELCLLFTGLLFGNGRLAAFDLSPSSAFHLPALITSIQQVKYYRSDNNEVRILAGDSIFVTLYNPASSDNSVVITLKNGWIDYDILYADINRDSIADIAVAYYFAYGAYGPDTVAALFAFDGASSFNRADSCFFECDLRTTSIISSPLRSVYLNSLDLNSDGYRELVFSYDQHAVVDFDWFSISTTSLTTLGQTLAYYSFPDSLGWTSPTLLQNIDRSVKTEGDNVFIGLCADVKADNNHTVGTFQSLIQRSTELIDSEGQVVGSFGLPVLSLCTDDSTDFVNSFELLCQGNLDTSDSKTELLFRYHYYQSCSNYGSLTTFDTSFTELRMYRWADDDTMEFIWSRLEPEGFSNYVSLPDYPGCFFATRNYFLYKFDGLNGSLLETMNAINADSLFWSDPDKLGKRHLLGVTDRTVTVYDFDQPTDIRESDSGGDVPSSFELSSPYPNPFNNQTILMYSLPRQAEVKILVFNLLGQKVATLAESVKGAGEHRATWDASGFSSGVYLIKAEFGEETATVKAVLLK